MCKIQLNDFFETTLGYFSHKQQILDNPVAAIDAVRMIGVLPLEKSNFPVTDDHARNLSDIILKKASKQVKAIFEKATKRIFRFTIQ